MKKFSLFSLVVLSALLFGCSKDELQAPAATGESLTPRTSECTPERFKFSDDYVLSAPAWDWPCLEEPISIEIVGHWGGQYTVSASCVVVGTFRGQFEATGIGLESGHSYRISGRDFVRDKFGVYNSSQNSAIFYGVKSRFDIVNETTGEVFRNASLSYTILINGNGEVIMDDFDDFECE